MKIKTHPALDEAVSKINDPEVLADIADYAIDLDDVDTEAQRIELAMMAGGKAAKNGVEEIFKCDLDEHGIVLYFFGPIGKVVKNIADFED